jgi:hypothetical protein
MRRFTAPNGQPVYPDRIHAPNDAIRRTFIAEGGPTARIDVVGELHLDRLRGAAAAGTTADALRTRWGARPDDTVMLFASECGREMAAQGRPSPYDEIAHLDQLLAGLAAGVPVCGTRYDAGHVLVVIRPHPRDVPGKYAGHIRENRNDEGPRVIVSDGAPPISAIAAADLVIGMDSTLLREADALGVPVVSLLEPAHETAQETAAIKS